MEVNMRGEFRCAGWEKYTNEGISRLVDKALQELPELTDFGLSHGKNPMAGQDALYDNDRIRLCAEWLLRNSLNKTMNRRRGSYCYKHEVEHMDDIYRGWIGEGFLIAAAVGLGLPYERTGNSIVLPISEKSYNANCRSFLLTSRGRRADSLK